MELMLLMAELKDTGVILVELVLTYVGTMVDTLNKKTPSLLNQFHGGEN